MRFRALFPLLLVLACDGQIGAPTDARTAPGSQSPGGPVSPSPRPDAPPVEAPPRPAFEFACADPGRADPGPSPLRRLTAEEFRRSIETTLGVQIEAELPPELRANGFENTAAAQVILLAHVEALADIAESVAQDVDLSGLARRLNVCTRPEECASEMIDQIGALLFRRPLRSEERSTLVSVLGAGENAEIGVRLAIETMLQSPGFLYRLEAPLDGHGIATRLAYFIWASAPDLPLLRAADEGQLTTDAQIEAQVERMLSDPRAQLGMRAFLRQWLELDRLDGLSRSTEDFPSWTQGLGADMKEETLRLFEAVAQEAGPLDAVHDANYTFASGRLAALYGFEPSSEAAGRWDLSDVPERGGLLTQGSLLTVGGSRASLVERGLWFLETILCGEIDAPNVDVVMEMGELMPGFTQRHYAEERLQTPACAGCHIQMDPLAFGLARFDGAGVYREQDTFGNQLRWDGELIAPGDSVGAPYDRVAELARLLADHPRVRECQVLKATQYALGRALVESDGCSLAQIRDQYLAEGRTWPALVRAIALSPSLRRTRAP
ncbi:MAG: DUF1592 domain-containing protein [Myxococcota bacterium]